MTAHAATACPPRLDRANADRIRYGVGSARSRIRQTRSVEQRREIVVGVTSAPSDDPTASALVHNDEPSVLEEQSNWAHWRAATLGAVAGLDIDVH